MPRKYYRSHSVYFESMEIAERFRTLYPELFINKYGFWIGLFRTNIDEPNKYLWHCCFQCDRETFDGIKKDLKLKRKIIGRSNLGKVKTGWCFVKEVK